MVSNKIISIIIPTYNMEKYLHKCLKSLIIPHVDNIEVLVINDGSKDRSSFIAHEYTNKYPNSFKVIDKENGNYGSCINRGLKEATGKYVKILDADDSFNTEKFEQYIIMLLNTDADLVVTDYDIVNEVGEKKERISYKIATNLIMTFEEICTDDSFKNIQMHSVTYKSELFSKINYYQSEGIFYTDQEWIFTPMSAVESCIYYPISVYKYLYGRQGQTMDSKILLRNISHTMQGIYKMCDDYNFIDKCGVKIKYFDFILYKRCVYIYKNYLILHPELDVDELIVFDQLLKQIASNIYDLTNNIVLSNLLPFQYVKKWRLNSFHVHKLYFGIVRSISSMLCK